jgi:cysteine synthase
MKEIYDDLDNKVDEVFIATGTCGTIRGCSDYIKREKLPTKVVAVDSEGSVIFGDPPKARKIPGYGAAIRPGLYKEGMADDVIHVSEINLVRGCRILLKEEAILAGGSAGALVFALLSKRGHFDPAANIVLILPDRGERYMETVYNDKWVKENL